MRTVHELQWQLRGRRPGWRWWLAVGVLLAALLVAAWCSWQVDARLAASEARLLEIARTQSGDRTARVPETTGLNASGIREVNAQVALLNRDWSSLLNGLAPADDAVKLLAMDINPATGAVRIDGSAATSSAANAYAQALQERSARLRDVRLLLLERQAGRIEFEVSAQWIE